MTPREQLLEDRAVRDAARRNLEHDLDLIRAEMDERGISRRLFDAGKQGAREAGGIAKDYARDNPAHVAIAGGVVATGVAAWIFRAPILAAMTRRLPVQRVERFAASMRSQITDLFRSGDPE